VRLAVVLALFYFTYPLTCFFSFCPRASPESFTSGLNGHISLASHFCIDIVHRPRRSWRFLFSPLHPLPKFLRRPDTWSPPCLFSLTHSYERCLSQDAPLKSKAYHLPPSWLSSPPSSVFVKEKSKYVWHLELSRSPESSR